MRHDLISLQLFQLVAQIGSIAGAATRQNMVASAVSKRISDLEAQIGTPLLYRKPRGVEVTVAGQRLLAHVQSLSGLMEQIDVDMKRYADGRQGTIRVAANSSATTQFLPEDLAEFVTANPELRIELAELTSAVILDAVRNGRCDIGIYSGLTDAVGLESFLYRRDTLVVVTHATHRLREADSVSLRDLLDEDFVALDSTTSIQSYVRAAAERLGAELKVRVTVQSFDGVRRMVQAKLGIAILPYGAVEPYMHDGDLKMVQLAEPWAKRDLLIAVRKLEALPRHAQLLLENLIGTWS